LKVRGYPPAFFRRCSRPREPRAADIPANPPISIYHHGTATGICPYFYRIKLDDWEYDSRNPQLSVDGAEIFAHVCTL